MFAAAVADLDARGLADVGALAIACEQHRKDGGLDPLPWTHHERRIRWQRWVASRAARSVRGVQFTDEFKAGAVRLVLDEGKTVAQVARDLDLTRVGAGEWVQASARGSRRRQDRADDRGARPSSRRSARRVAQLRMERDILKKAAAFFAKESDVKFAFVAAEKARGRVDVTELCSALGVSRVGLLRVVQARAVDAGAKKDAQLKVLIKASFDESRKTYGSPRVLEDLRDER